MTLELLSAGEEMRILGMRRALRGPQDKSQMSTICDQNQEQKGSAWRTLEQTLWRRRESKLKLTREHQACWKLASNSWFKQWRKTWGVAAATTRSLLWRRRKDITDQRIFKCGRWYLHWREMTLYGDPGESQYPHVVSWARRRHLDQVRRESRRKKISYKSEIGLMMNSLGIWLVKKNLIRWTCCCEVRVFSSTSRTQLGKLELRAH